MRAEGHQASSPSSVQVGNIALGLSPCWKHCTVLGKGLLSVRVFKRTSNRKLKIKLFYSNLKSDYCNKDLSKQPFKEQILSEYVIYPYFKNITLPKVRKA